MTTTTTSTIIIIKVEPKPTPDYRLFQKASNLRHVWIFSCAHIAVVLAPAAHLWLVKHTEQPLLANITQENK